MVKIQKKEVEFTWTKPTKWYMMPTVLFYQVIRTKPVHDSVVCLTQNILIKQSRITKELTANSFFLWLLQGSWGRKPQTWKAAKILNIQAFFCSKSGGYMKETKITSWEPLNIVFILCAQKAVRSYPTKKRKQNSTKQFFRTVSCMFFFPFGNAMQAAALCLIFVRNYEIDKDYNIVW